jgi:tetratricopeptide (TPR) repeat protein
MIAPMRLLVAVICCSAAALAQSANDQEAARAHFMAGSAYYEQANYADAVKEFTEAYRLSQRADLLYNIALAYERLEKWDQAIAALNQYLHDKPDAQDRAIIQTRIENLNKRRIAALAVVAPAPPPAPPAPPRKQHVASLVVGGIGVGALLASIGTGVAALELQSQLDSVCPARRCPSSQQQGKIDEGGALALSTDILIGVGAAAVLVGVILFVVESRHPQRSASLAPGGMAVRF